MRESSGCPFLAHQRAIVPHRRAARGGVLRLVKILQFLEDLDVDQVAPFARNYANNAAASNGL